MKYAALTGISPAVIAELKLGRPRTLELHSAHNVITLASVEPDSMIFMTSTDLEDLSPGDQGIIAHVLGISINMSRVVEISNPIFYEERERMTGRIQLRFLCTSTVKKVEKRAIGEPVFVDAVKPPLYCAG